MTAPADPQGEARLARPRRRHSGWSLRLTPAGVVLLMMVNLAVLTLVVVGITRGVDWSQALAFLPGPWLRTPAAVGNTSTATLTRAALTPTPPEFPTATNAPARTASPTFSEAAETPQPPVDLALDLIVLALDEGKATHLFAYQPSLEADSPAISLTRLTDGPWQDLHPALSPDGEHIAFASNRSGYWDLYMLELTSGAVTRLTDSLTYEAAPAWSPDGQWIVYETYLDENLELMIQSVAEQQPPIRLTSHPAADHSPAWSPQGREIAFVSTRSGESEIWLADLDQADEQRYRDISQNPDGRDVHPAWSPDGKRLVWSAEMDGFHNLLVWEAEQAASAESTPTPSQSPRVIGSGDWPTWSADGKAILTLLLTPNQTYLTAYPVDFPGILLPPVLLPGSTLGLTWGEMALPWPMREPYKSAALQTPQPLYIPEVAAPPEENGDRYEVMPLEEVEAPYSFLHDLVDEAFQALRLHMGEEAGWDFLSTLENAYVPLTDPLDPGLGDDWLYTGRAIALNGLPLNAGWLAVQREDFGAQTFWRVYLRTLYQDGSSGLPLHDLPWDLNARYSGDPVVYEQGGALYASIPPGYWLDITQRTRAYGWERIAALSTWRAAYPAARFNEFVITGGLDWQTAMLQLYPPEVLITPSPIIPPTITPTSTPRWYQSPTPTLTPTPRPTFTPAPPTSTVTATITPSPTITATRTQAPPPTRKPSPTSTVP